MRIAVFTDVHANLPALKAVLAAIRGQGCDMLFHTGDAIAIGPHPYECLDLLLNIPNIQFVMGNHEAYFVDGIPDPQPDWMSDGEVEHQLWTHAQLDPGWRSIIARWPYIIEREFEGVKTTFVHYALTGSGRDFVSTIRHPTVSGLDRLFAPYRSQLIFYGHDHSFSDLQGRARYIDPSALGCQPRPVAPYCVVEFGESQFTVEHCSVPYDDSELVLAFEERQVPARQFISRAFFGGRFKW